VQAFFVIIPLISVIILNLPFRALMKRVSSMWLAALLVLQIDAVLSSFLTSFPINMARLSVLHIDRLAAFGLLTIAIVVGAALLVGRALFKDETKLFNFTNLLLIALSGLNGIVMVTDIFSLYVFIEIAAVASYILISFDKEQFALEAAFKYIILSAFATSLMLVAIALIFLLAGKTDFVTIHAVLSTSPHRLLVMFAIGLFVCGLFIKGGLMPFHGWLPGVYSQAPAAVSVLLAGIMTKVLGVFILIRLAVSVLIFSPSLGAIALFVGTFSIIFGAFAALGQNDFKRMLAFSSISQVGYILIGLGAGNILGMIGSVFHLFNHAIFKSTLFVNSAAIESQTGTRRMDRMGGLASRMPVTGVTAVIASLSAAGLPPLSGFWSKLIIIIALWMTGHYVAAFIAVAASVLTLAYFLMMNRKIFWGAIADEFAGIREAKAALLFPACVLTLITVGLGVLFPLAFQFFGILK
jgi:multicomponent Na+:H+ antiporter subunit D